MTFSQRDPRDDRIAELEDRLAEMHRQLVQAQKLSAVGALASSITHEFNNILTTVINYAKMGLRHKDAATRDKAFDKILAAGQRASKITTGMLSYARNQSDRREPQDLTTLVQDVLVLIEKDLPLDANVQFLTITTDPDRDKPEVLNAFGAERGLDLRNWAFLTTTPGMQTTTGMTTTTRRTASTRMTTTGG